MPTYSTSLGCVSAEYTYGGKPTSFDVPLGSDNDHNFDARGGALGTITVLEGAPSATKVTYEVTVRSDDKSLLDELILDHSPDQDGEVNNSHLRIFTPHPSEGKCIRYDVKMYVPPTLKNLNLASHTTSHIQFDPDSHIQLDDLFVTLFSPKRLNMILPHNNLRAHKMQLEVTEGWIVGNVSLESVARPRSQPSVAAVS
ncbi:hypothetical protein B0H12DRAFT_1272736 [Mycena haematopus]|nr:hypothetical protein B0H12DRAFT_1272736 [Mycena haematopus]